MTQYAYFDSTVAAPSAVLGWYDTEFAAYPGLPAAANLLTLTEAQWADRMMGQWAVSGGTLVAYTPATPTPTPAQQAAAAISAGVQVISTNTPALNGTYAIDPASQMKIMATSQYISVNGKFYGGATTYPWLDMSGTAHTFPSVAEFQAFASAVAAYVAALDVIVASDSGTLPAQPVTIP